MIIDDSCVLPFVYLDAQDCIGDTAGKYNYNALALKTTLCNLSSYYYNYFQHFGLLYGLESILAQGGGNANDDYLKFKDQISMAETTVNLLSSFWGNYEFSIQIPINAVSLSSNDLSLFAYTLSTVSLANVESIVNSTLKSVTELHLNGSFPPTNYFNYTVVNVSFYLYNLIPVVNTNVPQDPLIKVSYDPVATFNYNTRSLNANYTRDNVYLTTGIVLRYYINDEKWTYMGYYLNDQIGTAAPNYNKQVINQLIEAEPNTASKNKSILGPCDPIQNNVWYNLNEYIYANAIYTGTSSKLGTIRLTLRSPKNEIQTFSYKANGYNPNTNTGGTDVILEINGDIINAYEQYPITKTLVQSWVNPFKGVTGVNFKYDFDISGVSYTLCASKTLI